MPRQPGGPGTGKSLRERCSHKENLVGVGSAEPTAAAGNAEGTPLPEGHEKEWTEGEPLKCVTVSLTRLGYSKCNHTTTLAVRKKMAGFPRMTFFFKLCSCRVTVA